MASIMSLYQLKSQFQDQLRPISDTLVEQKITANQVTVSAILLSIGTAYIIAKPAAEKQALWLLLPSSLFIRMALNAIDGMMAREHGQASKLGAILNEAGDIIADTALLVSLTPHIANNMLSNQRHISRLIVLSMSTELLAIGSDTVLGIRANQGPLGKSDRAFILGVLGAFMGSKAPLLLSPIRIRQLCLLTEALLIKTCLNRLRYMTNLYLMRQPPVLKSTLNILSNSQSNPQSNISDTKSDGLTSSIFLHNSAIKASILESKIMPSMSKTTINATAALSQKTGDMSFSKQAIISGESCYNAYDGTAIYYRYWLTMALDEIKKAEQPATQQKRQVILLHRGHEHSGRLAELGQQFAAAGYQVFAWDARGNGRSGGIKDHAESVTQLERDLNDFVQMVIGQTGIASDDTLIVASSIGAVLAAAWVHDYAPNIRGMILGTPALRIRLYMPFAIPSLKVARALGVMSRVSSYVKAQVLTHDKEAQQAYNADPLISNSISTDLLIDTHATGQRLLDDAGAITVPTFVLCAGKDYVVDKQAERDFYEAINTTNKRWQLYPGQLSCYLS